MLILPTSTYLSKKGLDLGMLAVYSLLRLIVVTLSD